MLAEEEDKHKLDANNTTVQAGHVMWLDCSYYLQSGAQMNRTITNGSTFLIVGRATLV